MHYMILMSKKMTSQKKLGEIKLVPYSKPLNDPNGALLVIFFYEIFDLSY